MPDQTGPIPAFFEPELMIAGDVPFEERRASLLAAARAFLDYHREICLARHRAGAGGAQVVACVTELTDTLIRNLYRCTTADWAIEQRPNTVVIALGGYGRGELNPRSDIDLMFFCGDKTREHAEMVAQRMLYLLWDLNLEVGYSVRTAKECILLAGQDLTIRTALLDARFLAGDEALYGEFNRQVLQHVLGRNTQAFLTAKYE
jgi:[protein-PII] uridylyltransferase